MTKRPNSSPGGHGAKRQQIGDPRRTGDSVNSSEATSEAFAALAEQADELVECLQILKQQLSQSKNPAELQVGSVKSRLSRLSKQLLPSFEIIGSLNEPDVEMAQPTVADATPTQVPEATQNTSNILLLSNIKVTPWTSSEIRQEWPPLPPILDPKLAEEVFTHPGLGLKYNYERLEWLGDAYIELIASSLIHQTFTQLRSGTCAQLRERCVRNITLAEFFRHYDMSRWAKLPGSFRDHMSLGRGRSKDKDLLKTQADMFEAYVAAIILSDPERGLITVVGWLRALWGRTLREDIYKAEAAKRQSESQPAQSETVDSSAKQRLSVKIVTKGVTIEYKDLPGEKRDKNLGLPLFTVGAYLTGYGEVGRLLAVGTALSKKDAGNKAAEAALQNKRLIQAYEEKKKQYMQARDNNSVLDRLL
ncbi:ribonuclease III [Trichoderma citrinoviride]|uniref:Ribonuclease III n=1 Tax=Trichoderma citrinoviride TaxID=58853 RepID=A0A2T4BE28_9HYPO|nr:ribonuclease III [Trichoderma citrinoviride]PTB67528.1 ribonuclease III [Trichoderma citrinoviride]